MDNMKGISLLRGEPMEYPSESTLHELFAESASAYPNHIATVFEGRETILGELNEMSDALARWLYHECDTRVGSIVGILMERCDEYVVAMLAALKAGAAFMPIEIVYPPDLIESVLEDSTPTVVLTKDKYLNRLPSGGCRCLFVDYDKTDWILAARSAPSLPPDRDLAHSDSMAYVVMSSGTTGTPKGICCPHRGMVHGIYYRLRNVPYEKEEAEAIHVFFIWEVLRPLLGGVQGTPGSPVPAHILPDNVPADPRMLVKILEEKAITRMLATPSLLSLILHKGGKTAEEISNSLKGLRLLVLQEIYPNPCCHVMQPGGAFADCGPPINNVIIQIIKDDDFEGGDCTMEGAETVPIGHQGRILVGGPTLAIGYLNRPEVTRRRFVQVLLPGGTTQKVRMYDTGDRGLVRGDGSIEVVGRMDYMVKIRGYSVVVPAIEAAIAEHPDVSAACVLVEGAEGTDKVLKAYIVPKVWEKVPTVQSLIAHLQERVPPYALPKTFVLLDSMPVHSTGKTDRKVLALDKHCGNIMKHSAENSDDSAEVSSNQKAIALSPTEKVIAEVWSQVLDISIANLTPTSNFSEVGGHSLLLFDVVMAIQEKMAPSTLELCVKDFISNITIESLARLIHRKLLRCNGTAEDGEDADTAACSNLVEEAAFLDPSIFPAPTRNRGTVQLRYGECAIPPQRLFLTGATGFLGAHILSSLLCSTYVTIYALVRVPDKIAEEDQSLAALIRVASALRKMGLNEAADIVEGTERCVMVCGDLSKPLLGLEYSKFKSLAGELDAILHCGAYVNLLLPYKALKAINVLGTQEILRLAVTNGAYHTKVKPVHYISTFGIFQGSGGICMESDNATDEWKHIKEGYSQSKWVAEHLCRVAHTRALPLSILRVGNMGPSSKTLLWSNEDDFMRLALLGCYNTGTLPIDAGWKLDMTPVDFAADAIAHLVATCPGEALGHVLHVTSHQEPLSISNVDMFRQDEDIADCIPLDPVSFAEWKHSILDASRQHGCADTKKLSMSIDSISEFFSQTRRFDCTQFLAALEGTDIKCPKIDRSYFARLFRSLIE